MPLAIESCVLGWRPLGRSTRRSVSFELFQLHGKGSCSIVTLCKFRFAKRTWKDKASTQRTESLSVALTLKGRTRLERTYESSS